MVLTLDNWDLSPTSSPTALIGRYGSQGLAAPAGASGAGSRDWPPPFLPSSSSPAAAAAAAIAQPSQPTSQSPSPSPSQTPTPSPSHGPPSGSHASPSAAQTSSCAASNSQVQGSGHRLGSKPSSLGLAAGGGDRRNGSPCLGKPSGQQQAVAATNSPSNSGSGRNNGGVTLYPYQASVCGCNLMYMHLIANTWIWIISAKTCHP